MSSVCSKQISLIAFLAILQIVYTNGIKKYLFHTDPLFSQSLYTLGGNKHYELMYSLGVSLLHAGQASKAFDCFTEAAQRLHNNPKLWLRMAECCIYNHKYVSIYL